MILFRVMSDDEIVRFYREIREALEGKEYRILYLASDQIEQNIDIIRRERSDENGNELWFPLMMNYYDNCPFAKVNNLAGPNELMKHLHHRQDLEIRLCKEIFEAEAIILKSKNVDVSSL